MLQVERAIKEQNLLDVLFMVERILRILHERAQQIQTNKLVHFLTLTLLYMFFPPLCCRSTSYEKSIINDFCVNRQCPNELREAVASLIYAAPRCGECPVLLRISKLLRAKFMKHSYTISPEVNQEVLMSKFIYFVHPLP